MLSFLALLAILGLVFSATSVETRKELGQLSLALVKQIAQEAARSRPEIDQFREALRARTRWALVTPALIVLNIAVFFLMLHDAGAVNDPATVIRWGGNFWMLTRNGQWWRLVTSMFVHAGTFQLLVNGAALYQSGMIVERLVGRLSAIAVYLTAGIFASLVNLTTHPEATAIGASGAIFGLYGLLIASSIWTMRHRSSVTIPLPMMKTLAPAALVFVLYNLASDSLGTAAELTGLLVGLVYGTLVTRGVSDRKPAPRRAVRVVAAAVVMAVLAAIPLRGVTDVKPELERTAEVESRTAAAYEKAAGQYRNGRMTAEALALLIDRTILPELEVTDGRLKALVAVPPQHQPLVANAEEYMRLRSESWRLRSEYLRKVGRVPTRGAEAAQYKANNRTMAQAEITERAALEALKRNPPAAAEPTQKQPHPETTNELTGISR